MGRDVPQSHFFRARKKIRNDSANGTPEKIRSGWQKIVSNTNGEREESERRATDTIVDEIVRNCWKGKFKEREEEDVF
jgi:hypothetical protein